MIREQIAEDLYQRIRDSVHQNPSDAVLFSGGIDSSIVLNHNFEVNPDILPVTVAPKEGQADDERFSKIVSEKIGAQPPKIKRIDEADMERNLDKVISSLGTFSEEWVASGLTLYFGVKGAKQEGASTISSGEGSDDLFGSFPGFLNWQNSQRELKELLERRIEDIDLMTRAASSNFDVEYLTPFHDDRVRDYALDIPMEYRTVERDGETISKFILRQAYKDELPDEAVNRPQNMAFNGPGTYDFVQSLADKISDRRVEELERQYDIEFSSDSEAFLFEKYDDLVGYEEGEENYCTHCSEEMEKEDSVHCRACGTLEYDGEIIPF